MTTIFSDAYRDKPLQNAQEILRQTSLLGVFALGAAIVIISGGIDLSSGSVIAFSGSVCASIMLAAARRWTKRGNPMTDELGTCMSTLIAIAGTLVAGFLIGTLHAWLITVVGLPPVRGHAGLAGRPAQPGQGVRAGGGRVAHRHGRPDERKCTSTIRAVQPPGHDLVDSAVPSSRR